MTWYITYVTGDACRSEYGPEEEILQRRRDLGSKVIGYGPTLSLLPTIEP